MISNLLKKKQQQKKTLLLKYRINFELSFIFRLFLWNVSFESIVDEENRARNSYASFFAVSRKKFAQLARVFTGRKKRSAKQILGQGAAPSKDSLLLNSEPLLVGDDEDTDDAPSADRNRE